MTRRFGHLWRWTIACAALLASLGACTGPTPYQPAIAGFGYTEEELEPNHYHVRLVVNAVTPRATLDKYVMLRAAEITLESGHQYFAVGEPKRTIKPYGIAAPTSTSSVVRQRELLAGSGVRSSFGADSIELYQTDVEVTIIDEQTPGGDDAIHDANEVLSRLDPSVERRPVF